MNLNEIDLKNVGSLPFVAKLFVWALIVILTLALIGFFFIKPKFDNLASLEKKEQNLRQTFRTKHAQAAQITYLKNQQKQLEAEFSDLLKQLPDETEIEQLLDDITQEGLSSGLDFKVFKPLPEEPKDFYAVKPIEIIVEGSYNQFGTFVSNLAALPTIVTQHEISMRPLSENTFNLVGEQILKIRLLAQTYRYLDKEEIQAREAKKSKGKRRRRR